MDTYKVTPKVHFSFFKNLLIFTLLLSLVVPILSYYKKGYFDVDASMQGIFWTILVLFTPKLLIHLNYYFANMNMIVYYQEVKKQLRVADKERDITFSMSDIKSVTEYKTYPKAENRTTWLPWDDYHYSLVELKNGEKFYFTSLILPNLDLPIDKSKITLKKRFYPAIW